MEDIERKTLKGVVGVGASAGGLEALSELVSAIPDESGLAFVVIQHLSPDHPSMMHELLASHTRLPVRKIEDGMPVEPDTIFVIPSGPALKVSSGVFRLVPRDSRAGVRTPIDTFLISLAKEYGELASCVILSGTGSDGTTGLKAVKSAGGIAIVQEAASARFAGMPDSAAATGVIDARLNPREVPTNLISLINHRDEIRGGDQTGKLYDSIETRLNSIIDLLASKDGQDFSHYKPGTLVRRIERRMMLQMKQDIDSYLELLRRDRDERTRLMHDFLIGVTRFFRDPKAFEALTTLVIKPILNREQDKFRVWVPGCSTGEEAYSIGILFAEAMRESNDRREFQIFGTDIDMNALRQARTAIYADAALEGMPSELLDRYFSRVSANRQVDFRLRERFAFAPHNLLSDPPFSRIDFISCRNLLIYLNAEGQNSVMPRFHYSLMQSGFLFLGPSESVPADRDYFTTISRDHRIYRRNDQTSVGFSALTGRSSPRAVIPGPHVDPARAVSPGQDDPSQDYEDQVDQFFLSRLSPPFLVISSSDEVRYLAGTLTPYMRHAKGVPSTNIEDLLSPEIRSAIRPLVESARESAEKATQLVPFNLNDTPALLRISAETLPFSEGDVLVVLQPVEVADGAVEAVAGLAGQTSRSDFGEVAEQELSVLRKRLARAKTAHATAEQELRNANEELLSMNEELQSSNEELETSREELQSINEELETINAELSENNRQLNEVNSDLRNILDATEIAKLILAKDLIVRRFTRSARDILTIDDRDIGRKVSDLKWHVDYPELSADVARVETTLQFIERELVNPRTGEIYEVRVRPYRGIDNRLDGCIITFVNITRRKAAESELQESREQLAAALEAGELGVHIFYPQSNRLVWDDRMRSLWNVSAEREIDYELFMNGLHPDDRARTQAEVEKSLDPAGDGRYLAEYRVMQPDGSLKWIRADGKMTFAGGKPQRLVGTVKDITQRHEDEMRMKEYTARLELTYEVTGIAAWEWNLEDDTATWTPNLFDLLGCDRDRQPSLSTFMEFIVSEDRARVSQLVDTVLASGKMLDTRFRINRGDGQERVLVSKGRVIYDKLGKPQLMIGINYDVTDEVEKEERRRLLTSELNHRVKNSLATIQSIASQTLRHTDSIESFKASFLGRLRAISMAHDLLVNGKSNDAGIAELVSAQVRPYTPDADHSRLTIEGPPAVLGASVAHGLGLVLHELATNASKYGALSSENGQVAIDWRKILIDNRPGIRLTWTESGGPQVEPPGKKGFGTVLIEKSLSHSIGGTTRVIFEPEGITAIIESPIRTGDD